MNLGDTSPGQARTLQQSALRLTSDPSREVTAHMRTVPAPSSADEALAMLRAGMSYLAAADPTAMASQAQAECLQALEQLDSVQTAARARILAAFPAGQGDC